MIVKTGLGQDSHSFDINTEKPLVIAGVIFENEQGLKGNSDADVVLHALCNSISSISGITILGPVTDQMCKNGITDSSEYLKKAMETVSDYKITHVSVSIECKRPKINSKVPKMKERIAELMQIDPNEVGITATTGEGLTEFGKGNGIQALTMITAIKD